MTTYIVNAAGNHTEYKTKAEALAAAVLAWDAQGQTGKPVAVYSDDGYAAKLVMAFEDRARMALERLIPMVEKVNYYIANLEDRERNAENAADKKECDRLIDDQMRRVRVAMNALSGAGFPCYVEADETVEVTRIEADGSERTDEYDQYTDLRVGRWVYYMQEKEWHDLQAENDFPAAAPNFLDPVF